MMIVSEQTCSGCHRFLPAREGGPGWASCLLRGLSNLRDEYSQWEGFRVACNFQVFSKHHVQSSYSSSPNFLDDIELA